MAALVRAAGFPVVPGDWPTVWGGQEAVARPNLFQPYLASEA